MTTEKMLQEIQEKIADKTLSFGCRVLSPAGKVYTITSDTYVESNMGPGLCKVIFTRLSDGQEVVCDDQLDSNLFDYEDEGFDNIVYRDCIGHPVMIGDVLEYLNDKGKGLGINQRYNDYGHTEIYSDGLGTIDLICAWKDFKKPISDQSHETIKAIWEIICKS